MTATTKPQAKPKPARPARARPKDKTRPRSRVQTPPQTQPPPAQAAQPSTAEAKPRPSAPSRQDRERARVAGLLRNAADPTRLEVLWQLAEAERNVTDLCRLVGGQSQPAVSHHLALLRHGRLIEPRRDGKNNIYALTESGRALAIAARGLLGSGRATS